IRDRNVTGVQTCALPISFGAIFFGRIGDLVGRKYAFLVTLLIMGSCTAAIGLLPSYAVIHMAAPILLLLFRILQGLALGGEYGRSEERRVGKEWRDRGVR